MLTCRVFFKDMSTSSVSHPCASSRSYEFSILRFCRDWKMPGPLGHLRTFSGRPPYEQCTASQSIRATQRRGTPLQLSRQNFEPLLYYNEMCGQGAMRFLTDVFPLNVFNVSISQQTHHK